MSRRVVVLGATGSFGRRLAERLAAWPELELVLAARSAEPLAALKAQLTAGAKATLRPAQVDRDAPSTIVALHAWAVIDAAGPFQGAGYGLARAVIDAGAHWIDLADARGFVAGFAAALDDLAKARGVLAVTGASSTPALTSAALDRITAGWRAVDMAHTTISPGAQSPGLSLTRAVLSQAGQRVACFTEGTWTERRAWVRRRRVRIPGLGRRPVALADTPDLDFLPRRVRREGLFFAGVEPPILQRLIGLIAWPGLPLSRLARPLRWLADRFTRFGDPRGGMVVEAEGVGADGATRRAHWSLAAEAGAGPNVPTAPASAVLRALLDRRLAQTGAVPCVGLVDLEAILTELAHLPIATRLEAWSPDRAGLFPRALGDAFDTLPTMVRRVHGGDRVTLVGKAVSAGRGFGALLGRIALGLPGPGRHETTVEIIADARGEVWMRRFGQSRFASRLSLVRSDPGIFQERMGPAAFRFAAECDAHGFRWRQVGWGAGPIPLPSWLGPRVRARCFERDGAYRFSVVVAHPWLGVIAAYAGRLVNHEG